MFSQMIYTNLSNEIMLFYAVRAISLFKYVSTSGPLYKSLFRMRLKNIPIKVVGLFVFLFIIVSFIWASLVVSEHVRMTVYERFESRARENTKLIAKLIQQDVSSGLYPEIISKISELTDFEDLVEIIVIDSEGELIAKDLRDDTGDYTTVTYRQSVYARGDANKMPTGYLEVKYSKERIENALSSVSQNLLYIFGCVFLVILIVMFYTFRFLIAPLQRVTFAVTNSDMEKGSFERPEKSVFTEINLLTDSFSHVFKKLFEYIEMKEVHSRNRAIAKTTQMLAHDVRKPFSMLKALISMTQEAKSSSEQKEILDESLPSIKDAIHTVEGMIEDVMLVGAETKLSVEEVQPGIFLSDCLYRLFGMNTELDINLSFDISDTTLWQISPKRFSRVFANIIGNAVEHMHGKGNIWIYVTHTEAGFSKITIGNSDSYIPEEDRAKLFESFFTRGKENGTGLGLAIAKKIVEAHGGSIHCQSSRTKGTEFMFTMPSTESLDPIDLPDLPSHSSDYLFKQTAPAVEEVGDAAVINEDLLAEISAIDFNLIVLDDEKIYIDSLKSSVKSLGIKVEIHGFDTSRAALMHDPHDCELIILDVDLGQNDLNGFQVCRRLRERGYEGKICIHSNRGRLEYQPKSIEAGADFFLPKPMNKSDLLQLLAQSSIADYTPSRKRVLLFEDERIYQRQWRKHLTHVDLTVYASLSEAHLENVEGIDFVVTDYYLKNGETGAHVAAELKRNGYRQPIFLSSNLEESEIPNMNLFTAKVCKDVKRAVERIN